MQRQKMRTHWSLLHPPLHPPIFQTISHLFSLREFNFPPQQPQLPIPSQQEPSTNRQPLPQVSQEQPRQLHTNKGTLMVSILENMEKDDDATTSVPTHKRNRSTNNDQHEDYANVSQDAPHNLLAPLTKKCKQIAKPQPVLPPLPLQPPMPIQAGPRLGTRSTEILSNHTAATTAHFQAAPRCIPCS